LKIYRAAVIGCSRMGGFIDNEVVGYPAIMPPFSHGAGFYASDRTDLVACADLRPEVMVEFGKRYDVPPERQYTDYHELIDREQPDLVSVATQPEQRAEIVVYAAEHGVRAIYAEKAMAASMAEADAMVEAVERNGVAFNLGTNRRWHPGFDRMKELIDGGELGALRSLIAYQTGTLFNTASHVFDLLLRLNSDRPVAWVQAHLPGGGELINGGVVREDPVGHGFFQFEDGVTAYALLTPRGVEFEAVCERGTLTSFDNGIEWQIRRPVPVDPQGRSGLVAEPFPAFELTSTTANLIADLVHALDTGEPPRGGVRVARAGTELIFAFMESHLRGGARVTLPLAGCTLRLQRDRAPRQPRYTV
jgi:predicted dehydrogenase